jgi:putative ABC transport system permease protein
MSDAYLRIGTLELVLSAGLLAVNLALSGALRLGLTRRFLWASVRMAVQLLLVGQVLRWVFALDRPAPVLILALLMASLAGVAAVGRTSRRFAGVTWDALVSVLAASFLVTGVALGGIIRPAPWWDPQYLIPLHGMVLGNTLTGISLALERFLGDLDTRRGPVETRLALGATRWEAAHDEIQAALRTGMIPTLNSMVVMGVVSLPGMMTGQILAGAEPHDAVRYQIVVMFMIAAATALGSLGVVLLAFRTLFDGEHRLRLDRLRKVEGGRR